MLSACRQKRKKMSQFLKIEIFRKAQHLLRIFLSSTYFFLRLVSYKGKPHPLFHSAFMFPLQILLCNFVSVVLFASFPILLCLTEETSAIGFFFPSMLSPLLREDCLFLMSSASAALSLRLSTTDLLAFASLCLPLSLLPLSRFLFYCEASFSFGKKIIDVGMLCF